MSQLFIVGPPRTSSSMLFAAATEIFGLPGYGESHFIPTMAHALEAFTERRATIPAGPMVAAFDPIRLEKMLLGLIRKRYAQEFPDGRWVDKTPGPAAVLTVPLIYKAFPDAKVICTRRSGLEVVQSAMIKFGLDIEGACATWLGPMHALRGLRIAKVPLLEVEHRDLLDLSAPVMSRIADHVGRPELAEALEHFVRRHVVEATDGAPKRYDRLDQMPWTGEQKLCFERQCRLDMERFGYSF